MCRAAELRWVSKVFTACETEEVCDTKPTPGVRSLMGLHPTESLCTPEERQDLGGLLSIAGQRLGGDKRVKNPGKSRRWISQMAL